MSHSPLYDKIVSHRKQQSEPLKQMLNSANALQAALQKVMSSYLIQPKPEVAAVLLQKVEALTKDLTNKYTRFSNGLITVSIAGLEKSGKTTFLKKFTGIEELPTAAQRCTSVACEIICVDNAASERFVIEYYSREQLLENICNMLGDMQKCGENLWAEGRARQWAPMPGSVEAFVQYPLPQNTDIDAFQRARYCNEANGSGTLLQLKSIQAALALHSSKLGTEEEDRCIANLTRFASHKTKNNADVSDMQPLIRKISVYKNYSNTLGSLRLCDTPGVDDPNPQAQRRALNSIESDTDLLIIASRPGNKPSVTGLAELLANLKKLDKDAPWRERSLFLINWDKGADPTGEHAQTHKDEVLMDGTFDSGRVKGPYDVRDDESARNNFMEEVYNRLLAELPVQDKSFMERQKNRWEEIISMVTLQLLPTLRDQAPPLEKVLHEKLHTLFDKWFEDTDNIGRSTDYFMGRLKTKFGEKTKHIAENNQLSEMRNKVIEVLNDEFEQLNGWLEREASEIRCDEELSQPRSAVGQIMPKLSSQFSEIVKKLVNVVTNISPLVQREVLDVLRGAFGEDIADEFCGSPQKPESEQLAILQEKMAKAASAVKEEPIRFIAEQLQEFSNLSLQMAYILRHELRPCLNLLNPHHWKADRRAKLVERSCAILETPPSPEAAGDRAWLQQYATSEYPGEGSSAAASSEFLFRLAYCASSVLETLVRSNEGQLAELVEDYIEQASQTLASQSACRAGWKWGLGHYKHIILREPYAELERRSADSAAYHELIKELERAYRD